MNNCWMPIVSRNFRIVIMKKFGLISSFFYRLLKWSNEGKEPGFFPSSRYHHSLRLRHNEVCKIDMFNPFCVGNHW
jgi:hypothetical protein